MVRTERQPGAESRIGTATTKEKIRGSLNPERISECLGGTLEKLIDVPIHEEYSNIVAILRSWKITVPNEDPDFVTEIYINIDPKERKVNVLRQRKVSSVNSGELKLPFPGQDESRVTIKRVNVVKYYKDEGRVKFVKRGRGTTGGIDVFRSGKVELKGDPRLFL